MTKKNMLIDAAHPEEVRVAVIDNGKIEDFDFESAARKPLRGNIYLARVTRVEPSLQAAFVEYGGNRHGFLAFSEIHPDYYQIPVADREALQASEAEVADLAAKLELAQRGDEDEFDDENEDGDEELNAEAASAEADSSENATEAESESAAVEEESDEEKVEALADAADDADDIKTNESAEGDDPASTEEIASDETDSEEEDEEEDVKNTKSEDADASDDKPDDASVEAKSDDAEAASEEPVDASASDEADEGDAENDAEDDAEDAPVIEAHDEDSDEDTEDEASKDEEANEEVSAAKKAQAERNALFERYKEAKRKRSQLLRNYKIQEVIKRRQILLVQAVKEERGNKGAALTTYMSLAGRYCVLMPNTARGGGISRKIPNASDRRRLRRVVDGLEVPQGMGLIIRTAGAKRTKTEIKRDYDYLLRLWENIRKLTLESIAPCLIYEEANLIKRAIRDLYDKDISKVLVEGENGYREAKDFMKMLMPSHARNVQPYKEREPIFLKNGVENQLDGMYQPSVRLKSGGYIVIHQTEALIAIDVNSGRATRERNIELTALKTNIEAAYEAARQFRLRDLAGLIVIDFIDMEEQRNNRKVEKALKDGLKTDRARIQVGRISNFGLLELSRQRRRSGIVDGTTQVCPTCAGAGVIRSHEMAALRVLRAIEGEAISGKVGHITAHASLDVSLYVLNHNRDWLKRIEDDNGVLVAIQADPEKAGDAYDLVKSGIPRERKKDNNVIRADQAEVMDADEENQTAKADSGDDAERQDEREDGGRKRKRRRRRRKDASRSTDDAVETKTEDGAADDEGDQATEKSAEASSEDGDGEKPKRRRRRGRRGGRRSRKNENGRETEAENGDNTAEASDGGDSEGRVDSDGPQPDYVEIEPGAAPVQSTADHADAPTPETAAPETVGGNENKAASEVSDAARAEPEAPANDSAEPEAEAPKEAKRTRKGWWQRATGL